MTELGKTLKEARVKKGYDLDDIHNKTKIQKRYLEAIEEGNLNALPGHFYARAFIKSYAEVVGLDPSIVLEHIQAADLPQPSIEETNVPLRRTRQEKSPIQSGRRFSRVLLYSFAVLILFVIYFAANQLKQSSYSHEGEENPTSHSTDQGKEEASPETPPQSTPPEEPIKPDEAPVEEAAKPTLTYLSKEGNVFKYELSGVKNFDISITSQGNCWMRLQKDGKNGPKVEEVMLNAGSSKQWTLTDTSEAWLRLGAAPDVTILVNGQALDTSIMKRDLQHISITLKP